MILTAALCKYWSNYSSSTGCQTSSGSSVTSTGRDKALQYCCPSSTSGSEYGRVLWLSLGLIFW